jgi:hypothetical protein
MGGKPQMREFDLVGFAAHLTSLSIEHDHANRHALERAANIVETEAKRVIGTYDYDWPELAESTKAQRVALGYSENEPGLRSGEMRASIEHVVTSHEAEIGSDDQHLVYFELGTSKQPPRSVLAGAAMRKEEEVVDTINRVIAMTIAGEMIAGGALTALPRE